MRNRKYKKSFSLLPYIIVLVLAMIVNLGIFSVLRFNSAQLEIQLSGIQRNINRYTLEERQLRQVLSGLTSPIRIQHLYRDQLGMVAGTLEVITIRRANLAASPAPQPEAQAGWRDSMFAFFGFTAN